MATAAELAPGVESVESSGNPYAVSPKGAIGRYQITPTLGRQYGYQEGDLYDPRVQQDIYNRHMGYLLNKYKDPQLALAAWNEGEGGLQRRSKLPAETRAFIPKVLGKVGGAISGALGEGTAYAEEPPPASKSTSGKLQYSRSTGTFWRTGPDGVPAQVPIDQVPKDIRAKVAKLPASDSSKLPSSVPTKPGGESAEQWYERQFKKLPGWSQYVLPGTIGEAAATGANAAALALAPETLGASALIPIGAAMAGGYFEPSDQPWLSKERFERAGIEGGKELAGLGIAKGVAKTGEVIGRYASRVPMLQESTARIGRGIKALFNQYPKGLEAPETMDAIRRDIGDGRVKDLIGDRLGKLRKELARVIPEYTPSKAARAAHGLEGLEEHFAAIPEGGEKFILPDVDADGKLFPRAFSVGDGIEHIEKMNALSYTVANQPKGGELSAAYRKAGHAGRDEMEKQLNALGQKGKYGLPADIGTTYRNWSADFGTASELGKAVQKGNVGRTITDKTGKRIEVIDQPALKEQLDKKAYEHLSKLQGEGKKELFKRAVAPEGGAAAEETGGHGTVTPDLWHSITSFLGGPMHPEAREMLPWYARALTARRGAVPVSRALATPLVAAPRQFAGPLIHMDIRKTPEEMRSDAGG